MHQHAGGGYGVVMILDYGEVVNLYFGQAGGKINVLSTFICKSFNSMVLYKYIC